MHIDEIHLQAGVKASARESKHYRAYIFLTLSVLQPRVITIPFCK